MCVRAHGGEGGGGREVASARARVCARAWVRGVSAGVGGVHVRMLWVDVAGVCVCACSLAKAPYGRACSRVCRGWRGHGPPRWHRSKWVRERTRRTLTHARLLEPNGEVQSERRPDTHKWSEHARYIHLARDSWERMVLRIASRPSSCSRLWASMGAGCPVRVCVENMHWRGMFSRNCGEYPPPPENQVFFPSQQKGSPWRTRLSQRWSQI